MCGIAGWIDTQENISPQKDIIAAMTARLAPRGPDAEGFWHSPHALLGHRRLAVVDPAGGGQPMIRYRGEKEYVIVYNGELYNTSELRSELKSLGHEFSSNSDTEVLLESYIEWGSACTDRINGIYAFAVWSEKDQSLFLCRDRFGVKPLFYAKRGSSFLFASELKALLAHPLIRPEITSEGLAEIFALGPARTPGHGVFRDVHELKPSCHLLYDSSSYRIRQYWRLESRPHTDGLLQTMDTIKELVTNSIERQLVADVPVCVFLSGGLDSSLIAAVAASHFRTHRQEQLHSYSVDYVDNELYFKASAFQPNPDAPWIKRMSEEFNTLHHDVRFDTPQLTEALTAATEARDLPGMADVDSSLWLFCREVKKNATVALSGECADEVFGGYPWFHNEKMLNSGTFPWSMDLSARNGILSPDLIQLIRPEEYIRQRYEETLEEVPRLAGENPLEARRRELFYLNFTWFMQTLLDRKDRMSMAHGLEVRVPYCDHRLVQYVWNIPWDMKMLDGREKGLLRKALEGVLPNDILYRKKSPYPKTHNPSYERLVKDRLTEVLHDATSPLLPLVSRDKLLAIMKESSDLGRPWYGQLMAQPQLYAWLLQVEAWLRLYRVSIKI